MPALDQSGEFRLVPRGFARGARRSRPPQITMKNNEKTTKITMNNNAASVEDPRPVRDARHGDIWQNEPALPKRNHGRGARGIADLSIQTDAFPPCRGG